MVDGTLNSKNFTVPPSGPSKNIVLLPGRLGLWKLQGALVSELRTRRGDSLLHWPCTLQEGRLCAVRWRLLSVDVIDVLLCPDIAALVLLPTLFVRM